MAANWPMIGDVLHSRVARSDIIAFSRMGVKVELSGPPTLMPRAPEAMGPFSARTRMMP
jgi:aspartate carbamoyltransferase catalytic subunit